MNTTWQKICDNLQKRLSPGAFKVWVAPLMAIESPGKLSLVAPSEFVANWIQQHLMHDITEASIESLENEIAIEVVAEHPEYNRIPRKTKKDEHSVQKDFGAQNQEVYSKEKKVSCQLPLPTTVDSYLYNKQQVWKYAFSSFVVGPCNNLAHAAAQSITMQSGSVDMLFLSSGPGLGKTHLTQAVGKALCESSNKKNPKVKYLSAEEFCLCFVQALKSKSVENFKERFRDIDLLLLEDIHFLQNKEKMQDEVLSTIRSLQNRGSRVVLTSSFAPNELCNVDERLVSRFCSGFLVGIEKPDFDVRRRIIMDKAQGYNVDIPDSVSELLASSITGDIRKIESSLSNLVLKAKLLKSNKISMQMVYEILKQYGDEDPLLNIETMIQAVCSGFGLPQEKLFSRSRKQLYVVARNTIFYLARKHTDMSLQDIGEHFSRKHSTVLKGIASVERELQRKSSLGRQIATTLTILERNGSKVN